MYYKSVAVYGRSGHRFKGSFFKSIIINTDSGRTVVIHCADILKTNEYAIISVVAEDRDACIWEIQGQIEDGYFENCYSTEVRPIHEFDMEEYKK